MPLLREEIEELKKKLAARDSMMERFSELDAKMDELLQGDEVPDPDVLMQSFESFDRIKRKIDKAIAAKRRHAQVHITCCLPFCACSLSCWLTGRGGTAGARRAWRRAGGSQGRD